mmetsp:Transcript_4224/g.17850  ORF Transcript_4224/g.17850 Transcript_4224/m.17850 type:complete len:387 (-) Transcript_4224:2198-3358(-)
MLAAGSAAPLPLPLPLPAAAPARPGPHVAEATLLSAPRCPASSTSRTLVLLPWTRSLLNDAPAAAGAPRLPPKPAPAPTIVDVSTGPSPRPMAPGPKAGRRDPDTAIGRACRSTDTCASDRACRRAPRARRQQRQRQSHSHQVLCRRARSSPAPPLGGSAVLLGSWGPDDRHVIGSAREPAAPSGRHRLVAACLGRAARGMDKVWLRARGFRCLRGVRLSSSTPDCVPSPILPDMSVRRALPALPRTLSGPGHHFDCSSGGALAGSEFGRIEAGATMSDTVTWPMPAPGTTLMALLRAFPMTDMMRSMSTNTSNEAAGRAASPVTPVALAAAAAGLTSAVMTLLPALCAPPSAATALARAPGVTNGAIPARTATASPLAPTTGSAR